MDYLCNRNTLEIYTRSIRVYMGVIGQFAILKWAIHKIIVWLLNNGAVTILIAEFDCEIKNLLFFNHILERLFIWMYTLIFMVFAFLEKVFFAEYLNLVYHIWLNISKIEIIFLFYLQNWILETINNRNDRI